jgi:hypothetical protein
MQHAIVQKPVDARPVTLEVDGEPQGVLVPAPEGLKFLAVKFEAFPVDGQVFESAEAAREAIRGAARPQL